MEKNYDRITGNALFRLPVINYLFRLSFKKRQQTAIIHPLPVTGEKLTMVKCPFCQIAYVDNTLFCSECGYYLLDDDKRETDQLDQDEAGWLGASTESDLVSPLEPAANSITLRLKIGPKKRIIETTLEKVVHLGRLDPNLSIFPEIDVTDDIAPEKSVSRRHARILRDSGNILVEDLGSVNGTFINSKKLEPYLPELLANGDTIQLGTLLIEVEIVE